jgi:methylmalonyl-CoA mutase cobalamin-binding domain/chain
VISRSSRVADVVITVGGTIPEFDIAALEELGVAKVYTPGTPGTPGTPTQSIIESAVRARG